MLCIKFDGLSGLGKLSSVKGSVRDDWNRSRDPIFPGSDVTLRSTCPDPLDLTAFRDLVARADRARRDNDAKTAARYLNDAPAHWRGPRWPDSAASTPKPARTA
ncbi:hypothetical protein HRW07_25685 [Streptomyces lunaelactis]|uniref:BTAD domain-containing putative transcriptional regulator n=1 Tax=Streptomyces lunaelactis TaxID=1535768 RepID=UPI001584B1D4|nr:BTAD domain-containing putative transcriptional regulator [Streptomyces lunaelactis]NUL06562.1 hypothetical protein [Streptomyces lunaelactis]